MPLLSDSLTVWEIAFRWAGYDPRRLWLSLPLEVQDHCRNLIDAILSADLACESITLEKRDFEEHEKDFSVYYWLDDIYTCIAGHAFNRKLLRHALIGRYDLMLWCQRRNIPLPYFWFPPGWNLEYELPEGEIHPGHYYIHKYWSEEDWQAQKAATQAVAVCGGSDGKVADTPQAPSVEASHVDKLAHEQPSNTADEKHLESLEKLRSNQEAAIACRQIAKAIWREEPDRTIASVVKDPLLQKYGGGAPFVDATVREWIKVVAPAHVRDRRGRPRKNGSEDQ